MASVFVAVEQRLHSMEALPFPPTSAPGASKLGAGRRLGGDSAESANLGQPKGWIFQAILCCDQQ